MLLRLWILLLLQIKEFTVFDLCRLQACPLTKFQLRFFDFFFHSAQGDIWNDSGVNFFLTCITIPSNWNQQFHSYKILCNLIITPQKCVAKLNTWGCASFFEWIKNNFLWFVYHTQLALSTCNEHFICSSFIFFYCWDVEMHNDIARIKLFHVDCQV